MKYILYAIIFFNITACLPLEPVTRDNRAYELRVEEVAFLAGCMDLATKLKVKNAITLCLDLSFDFLQRHRKEWEN